MSANIEKTYFATSNTYAGPQSWDELKQSGSTHYKTGGIEPVDLYVSGGMFRAFSLCSIIKYAFRNRNNEEPLRISDLDKIIDYAQKLKAHALSEVR